ncbi:MAG: hypothetical protein JRD05_12935 [Deltaproteobacteria bacterium]|nr:hypothetical protein [Deltaproteobacteria bacterium]
MVIFEVCAYLLKIKSKIQDFEPDAEIRQISADFEMGRFEIGSSYLFYYLPQGIIAETT